MKIFVHPTAEVSNQASIGEGTKIWHQVQVRENVKIGDNCIIGKGVYIDKNVQIGNNCKIQNYACLYDGVTIGNDVFIGPHVCFTNDLYPRAVGKWKITSTVVGDGASIGANATVICGTEIGEYAMVGAGSVVTKNIMPCALAVGNPAKAIGIVNIEGNRISSR